LHRHTKGNTSTSLFELLIIVELEYHCDWKEPEERYWSVLTNTPKVINIVSSYHNSMHNMEVYTPEVMLKNISYIQNNLKLMGCRQFDYKEFVFVHHTLVDYFMLHGETKDLSSPKPTIVNVMEPRTQDDVQ
jgi:hypothetical protein